MKIDRLGIVHLLAGNGGSPDYLPVLEGTDARLRNLPPIGAITVGPDGKIYAWVNTDNFSPIAQLVMIDTDGRMSVLGTQGSNCNAGTISGSVPATDVTFCSPMPTLEVDADGSLYVVDGALDGRESPLEPMIRRAIVLKLDASGRFRRIVGRVREHVISGQSEDWPIAEDIDASEILFSPNIKNLVLDPQGLLHMNDFLGRNLVMDPRGGSLYRLSGIVDAEHYSDPPAVDGAPARDAKIGPSGGGARWIAIAPDGRSYETNGAGISVVQPPPAVVQQLELSVPSPNGRELFVFDPNGRHLRTIHADTNTTLRSFGYDAEGRLASVTDAHGATTTVERESGGSIQAIVAPHGQRTEVVEDAYGYLEGIRPDPEALPYAFHYLGNTGLLSTMVDPLGNLHSYEYDNRGKLARNLAPDGRELELVGVRDGAVETVTSTETDGGTTTYVTDWGTTGEVRSEVRFPDGTKNTSVTRANASTEITAGDGTITVTTQRPDPASGLLAPLTSTVTTLPSGLTRASMVSATSVLSDPQDLHSWVSRTTTTLANGAAWIATYDRASRTQVITSPELRSTTTVLDALGRPLMITVPGIAPTTFEYDPEGRLVRTAQGTGTDARVTIMGYWDDATHPERRGYLRSTTGPMPAESTTYTPDALGRLLEVERPDGEVTLMSYDGVGNVTSVTPPGNPAHDFTYTAANLADTYVAPARDALSTPDIIDHDYNLSREPVLTTLPDGRTIAYEYDTDAAGVLTGAHKGQLTRVVTTGDAVVLRHMYNATSGKLATSTRTDAGGDKTLSYTYDGMWQQTEAWGGTGQPAGTVERVPDSDFRVDKLKVNGVETVDYTFDRDGLTTGATSAAPMTIARRADNGILTGTTLGSLMLPRRMVDGFAVRLVDGCHSAKVLGGGVKAP